MRADFSRHVGERNKGDEKVMAEFSVQDRYAEAQMGVDFGQGMEMAFKNTRL